MGAIHLAMIVSSLAADLKSSGDAANFWNSLAASTGLQPLPPHSPRFSISLQQQYYNGSSGVYAVPTHVVRDAAAGGVVVAVFVENDSLGVQENVTDLTPGLNLLAPTPAMAPLELPKLDRYGWAYLYGCRMVTISWLDCCSVSGDDYGFTFEVQDDGASALLSMWQSWVPTGRFPGRTGLSVHNFTLFWDPIFGYSVDAVTTLRINNASVAGQQAVEFFNFLAPTLMQPWPEKERVGMWGGVPPSGVPLPPEVGTWPYPLSTHTAYAKDSSGDSWTGFANNILAGGEMDRYYMQPTIGATVFAVDGGFSPSVSWAASSSQGAAGMAQETCPAWGDQHHFVMLPPAPGEDGFFTLAPQFSVRWAPPAVGTHVLGRLTDVHAGPPPPAYPYPLTRWNHSNFLRVGTVEDFEVQAVPLTQPIRALVYSSGRSGLRDFDYSIVPGVGLNGSAGWVVSAMTLGDAGAPSAFMSPVPLLPLNVSTPYSLTAWVRLLCAPECAADDVTAQLWVGLYEENAVWGPGPSYGRLAYFNSTILTAARGALWEPVSWVSPMVTGDVPVLRSNDACSTPPRTPADVGVGDHQWTLLSIDFLSPPWASFADLRPIVVSSAGGKDSAVFDDWTFVQCSAGP